MTKILSLIKQDAYRYTGSMSFKDLLKSYFKIPGFRYMVWHRIANKYKPKGIFFYFLPWLSLVRLKYRYGYDIPAEVDIGAGFYIGHFGGIVISSRAKIGKNCNISQGVTIGYIPRGLKVGYPIIGDNVYIGPGSKILGSITIGNNSAIGANAVVLNDVPEFGVAVGIPSKVISLKGSEGYIINTI